MRALDRKFENRQHGSNSDIQKTQLSLETDICGLGQEKLISIAEHLNISTEGLRRLQLTRKIREKIEEELKDKEEVEQKEFLYELSGFVVQGTPALEKQDVQGSDKDTNSDFNKSSNVEDISMHCDESKVSVKVKRDFKIYGRVGRERHKDGQEPQTKPKREEKTKQLMAALAVVQ